MKNNTVNKIEREDEKYFIIGSMEVNIFRIVYFNSSLKFNYVIDKILIFQIVSWTRWKANVISNASKLKKFSNLC